VASLGVGSVLITAVALAALAMWQSSQYHRMAQREVDRLIDADLDHITQGIYNLVKTEDEAVQQQIDAKLTVAHHLLTDTGTSVLSGEFVTWTAVNQFTGAPSAVRLPKMLVGGRWLGQNADPGVATPVVDAVARLVGGTATVFQRMNEKGDMLRVATTVEDAEGRRAIGTCIPAVDPDGTPDPVITAILGGQTYHGRAFVVDAWHLTAYEPIRSETGDLLGMLCVGVRQSTVEPRLKNAILHTTVGKTGYVYVLSGRGEDRGRYIISEEGHRDSENIWDSKDSDGRYVVRTIIGEATNLRPGEMATVRYRWQNPGDTAPRWKLARLAYYAPWDWVIGTSAYEDELQGYRALLTGGRTRMTTTMGLAGLAITFLIGFVGVMLSRTITSPVQKMTAAVHTIIQGDLNQTLDIRSRDEIGVLAQAFNVMTGRLRGAMEDLRRSEGKYRYIFENSIEGLFQTSVKGSLLGASPAMARTLGYDSPDDLIACLTDLGRQLYVHPEDRDAIVSAALDSDRVIETEVQFYKRDGQAIWVLLNVRAVRDEAGEVLFLNGFLTDVTKRRQAEEELQKLATVIKHSTELVNLATPDGRMIYLNDAGMKMLGILPEEVASTQILDVIPNHLLEKVRTEVLPAIEAGGWNGDIEYRNLKTGTLTAVHATIFLITDPRTGAPLYYANSSLDITERKRAEKELRDSEARYRRLHESMMDGFASVDMSGRIQEFNRAYLDMLDYTEEELHRLTYQDLTPERWHDFEADIVQRQVLARGYSDTYEKEYRRRDGLIVPVELRTYLVTDDAGNNVGLWAVVRDITARKRSEEELQRISRLQSVILDNSTVGIALVRNRVFEWVNPRMPELYGLSMEQVLGVSTRIIYPDEETYQSLNAAAYPLLAQGQKVAFETRMRKGDGTVFWCRLEGKALGSSGLEEGVIWIAEDVTERKRAEEELQKLSRLQSVILDNSTVGIALVRNRAFEWVNPRMPELFGLLPEQLQGAPMRLIFPDDEAYQRMGAEVYPLLAQGEKTVQDVEMRKGDGSLFWCRLQGKAVDPSRPEEGIIWIAEDTTERKRAEEALARRIVALTQPLDAGGSISFDDLFEVKSIQRIQDEFAAATGVASIITHPDGTPITTPSSFCRLCADIIRQSEQGRANCYRSDAILGGRHTAGPVVQPCLSGGLWEGGAGIDVGGHHVANWLIGQVRDSTQTEESMRRYAREIGLDETLVLDAFREVPSMSREQFDRIAQLLFTIASQLSAMAFQNVQQSRFIADRQRAEDELRRHRDNLEDVVRERTAELLAKNAQLTEEISEREQAQQQSALMEVQLRQAQKLESIGQLAAGIAHEINTPIQYVGDNLRFLKEAFMEIDRMSALYQKVVDAASVNAVTPELLYEVRETAHHTDMEYLADEVPKAVQQGLEGVGRVASIVSAMKEFSHPGAKEKAHVDLNHAIETTVTIARNEWKYVADTELDLDPQLPPVPCLPGEFNQVILNLIINAAHAIADVVGDGSRGKGTITITTRRQNNEAEIRIQDTGKGIPEKARDRVFDPFFTTKAVGKGTGQGLAIAHSVVVDKHGGSIAFETAEGKGTEFVIRLPLAA